MQTLTPVSVVLSLMFTLPVVLTPGLRLPGFGQAGLAAAAEPYRKSDPTALSKIFGEAHRQNVMAVHRHAGQLAPQDRYAFLRDEVLPPDQPVIRIELEFAPAYLSSSSLRKHGLKNLGSLFRPESPSQADDFRDQFVAPVMQLVEVAKSTDNLDDLLTRVSLRVTEANEVSRESITLELLIAIAREDFATTADLIFRLQQIVGSQPVTDPERAAELIVMSAVARIPELRESSSDFAFFLYEQLRTTDVPRTERWNRHVYALKYYLQWFVHDEAAITDNRPAPLRHWHPVMRVTAETNGQGYPRATWNLRPGVVAHITPHDRDHLYYDVPLTGDFTIEADVSAFNYRDTRLGFGGFWAGPGYDHVGILNGRFADDDATIAMDPKLDELETPIRFQIQVNGETARFFVNGRQMFQTPVSPSDPWASICSLWYTHGWVENLRIYGDIEVPREIHLAADPRLPGWLPYYGGTLGEPNSEWRLVPADQVAPQPTQPAAPTGVSTLPAIANAETVLVGQRYPTMQGAFQESLLRYHRPVLEDGTISYEFFYEEGKFGVHPALGPIAFLLEPDGVKLHEMTDGVFERLGRDPAHKMTPQLDSTTASNLPNLNNQSWNRVELKFKDGRLTIQLNGELVHEQELALEVAQTFSLFHYADQTEARVRNITWQGEWPTSVPAPRDQELADDTVESLLADVNFKETFEHDFSAGLPVSRFLVSGEGWKNDFRQMDDGVHLTLPGDSDYVRYSIIPQVQLAGDFDVVVEFEDFQSSATEGKDSNIQLFVGIEENLSESRLYRKFSRYSKKELGEQIIQAAFFHVPEDQFHYTFPEQTTDTTTSGKLRLVRQQNKMHYLYAPGDSDNYRFLHSQDVPAGPTRPTDVRLVLETSQGGVAAVKWKSLSIRAERIEGPATRPPMTIAQLDDSRDKLKDRREFDYSKRDTARFVRTAGRGASFAWTNEGLLVTGPGFSTWTGHFITPMVELTGDFDIMVEVDLKELARPEAGGEAVVYLEATFRDRLRTGVQSKFAKSWRGTTAAEFQLRQTKIGNRFEYEELASLPFDEVHQLRIARRDGIAYMIFQPSPEASPILLGRAEVGNSPLSSGDFHQILHTGGANRQSKVLLKKLVLHADSINSLNVQPRLIP